MRGEMQVEMGYPPAENINVDYLGLGRLFDARVTNASVEPSVRASSPSRSVIWGTWRFGSR